MTVSSYTARVPEPFCGPYAAAKAAQPNLTRTLSRTYAAEGVLATCVLPGLTATDGVAQGFDEAVAATGRPREDLLAAMLRRAPIDVGRPGDAEEVASAVVFLCSERASWISGTGAPSTGGRSAASRDPHGIDARRVDIGSRAGTVGADGSWAPRSSASETLGGGGEGWSAGWRSGTR